MKTLALRTPGVLLGLLLGASFVTSASRAETQKDNNEVSLHAYPINSRSLLEMGQQISEIFSSAQPYLVLKNSTSSLQTQWPVQAIHEKPSLCKDLDDGCILIDYFDPEAFKMYPKFEASPLSEQELLGDHGIYSSEIVGRIATALEQEKLKKIPKKISENIVLTQGVILKKSDVAIQNAKHDLYSLGKLSHKTKKEILSNPYCYKDLPGLYHDFWQIPSAEQSLKEVMTKALWLTLESLTNSAYSRLPSFPYRNDDSINPNNFLTADFAYETLTRLERTTPMISLTPDLRQQLGQKSIRNDCGGKDAQRGFNSKTRSGTWFTVAAYVPNLNSFLIDFTQDFYETVYAFEHELWHAVSENTTTAQNYRIRLEELAKLPSSDKVDLALKQTIFWSVIQDELHAIHESNLLYRFAGQLTRQWGGNSPSAKGWHDSEFISESFNADRFYNPLSLRAYGYYMDHPKPSAGEKFFQFAGGQAGSNNLVDIVLSLGAEGLMAAGVPAILALLEDSHYQKKAQQELIGWNNKVDSDTRLLNTFRSKTEAEFPPEVIELFGDRYRLTLPDFKSFEQTDQISEMKFQKPEPAKLTCSQAQHIASLMPCEWDNGLPFYFVITDGECSILDGTHPENTGSHPHGAMSSVSALPCLNGAEAAE